MLSPIPNAASFDGNAISILTESHFSTDGATVYSASGLPKGLSIDPTTGIISGTIDHDASIGGPNPTGSGRTADSVYSITVSATNTSNPEGTSQTFSLDIANQPPVVGTVTAKQSNNDGDKTATVDTSTAFSDPNGDPLTYTANDLPPGLSISSTGQITGTVAGNAYPGTYQVTVTAADDKGAATSEVFAWAIADVPPTTKGTLAGQKVADGTGGISIATAGGFTPTNGNALYYAATGLPPGLTIDPTTGVISGAISHDTSAAAPTRSGSGATLDGTYTITATAYDGLGGSASQTFAFDATNTAPKVSSQTADQHSQDGQGVSVSAAPAFSDPNGDPLTFSASNLPKGLSIDPTSGLISGTIDKSASLQGPYKVTITATDDKAAATSETFEWVVDDLAPQATPPLADRSVNDGTAVSYATSAGFTDPNGVALTYSATGLPSGLTIDSNSGLISGTLNHDASAQASGGLYTVAVTVSDGQGGSATNTFHLTASNQAPAVTSPPAAESNKDGDTIKPVDASKAFTDPNPGDTLTYAASDLPKGLTIDPNTGVISGTVAGNAAPGGYYVTLTATDDKGAATPATFIWGIGDVPPTAQGILPAQHVTDGENGIAIATSSGFDSPNNFPLTYTATGLPRGLSINPGTGAITGFISHDASLNAPSHTGANGLIDGTYIVIVTADDGRGGTASQTFTIDSSNQAPTLGMPTADQHGADGQQVSLDAGKAFADPNTGDSVTFTASDLPAGLVIDPATGLITGTIDPHASASGPYTVAVTATDDKDAATIETFHWAVDDVPPMAGAAVAASSPDGTMIAPIDTASHFSNPNGLPLTYAATGLPAGLSIDPNTGMITGSVDHDASKNAPVTSGSGATLDGTYTVTVTTSDGQGGVATQTFTFDATNDAPSITAQTPDQRGTDGQAVSLDVSKAFTDPNTGDEATYAAGGLPTGLSIEPATGVITGTIDPRASSTGPYTVTVTATDEKGAATQETFAWTVADLPPTSNALPDKAANDGAAVDIATSGGFSNANGVAYSYTATGLPAGLAIDPVSGVISGTLGHDASIDNGSDAGTYTIAVTAADGQGGSSTDVFHLIASNQAPVVGTVTSDQNNADGATIAAVEASKAFSDPNGDPLTYTAANLPAGLSIAPRTGLITGTVSGNAAPGAYGVTVAATDDKGLATAEAFTWTIADVPPTTKGTLANQSFGDGTAGVSVATASAFADANGNALTYAATGLPAGLSIDPASGRISGTLDHDASKNAPATSGSGATLEGTYTVTVIATDGLGGSATQSFTVEASNAAPAVGSKTVDQKNIEGDTVSLDAASAFSDPNTGDVLTYAAGNLPGGLAIDPRTGLITGMVAGGDNAGSPYAVTVTATDDKGAATSETLSWTILPTKPGAASPLPNVSGFDGTAIAIDTASHFSNEGGATTYAASGLPAGLSIDPTSGRISGTLDHDASKNAPTTTGSGATLDGAYTVTVTATNGGGATAQSFTLAAANQAPVVGSKTADQSNRDGDAVTPVDASQAFADPNGDPLTYAASNLPAGLAIDSATGRITGTVASNAPPGTYQVAVTATDDKGAVTAETFASTIADVPPTAQGTLPAQTFADGQAGVSIATAGGFADANGNPLTYSATGLPAGISIDPTSGRISGTLDHDASKNAPATSGFGATLDGAYDVTVTATDGLGGAATQIFTLEARNQAPVLGRTTANQINTDGDTVSVDTATAFTDPNTGDVLTFAANGLPAGLAIDPKTGLVNGTVARGDNKTSPYNVTVTAMDDKGASTSETLSWTILPTKPGAASAIPDTSHLDGTAVSFDTASHFDTDGAATTYAASGLPAGLSIDPTSGRISGTLDHDASKNAPTTTGSGATLAGTYTVTVTATNAGGRTAQSFTLDTTNAAPVIGSKTAEQSNRDGDAVTPVDASQAFADPNGDPLTYAASNLPAGLAIDSATGRITGTVASNAPPGTYQVAVTATDDKGAVTAETFAWTIADVPPTAQGTLPAQTFADGQAGVSIATAGGFADANGNPLTYSATGLPEGLSIDPTSGRISGTLARNASSNGDQGTYEVTVVASDGLGGTASQTLTIAAANQAPVVGTNTADQHGQDGQAVSLDTAPAFADPNGDPLTYKAANLPADLSIDPASGHITGTLASTASVRGPYDVAVTATDSKGAATTETFAWTVDDLPPSANGTTTIDVGPVPDGATVLPFDASAAFTNSNGTPLTYAASGLPAGLAIDPATGIVTGTLDHDASIGGDHGTYTVTVTASDGQGGTASQIYALEATNQAPRLVAQTSDQAGAQGQQVASLDAAQAFADPNAGDVVTYAARGLPKGLAIDPATGLIGGTIAPDALPFDYAVTVVATDDKGAATAETFHWNVSEVPPVAGGSLPPQRYGDGQGGIAIDTAGGFASPNGLPLTYDASGLPAGLAIDPATGLITGTLDRNASALAPVKLGSGASLEGIYAVTITASDTFGGTTSQVFAFEVDNVSPAIVAQTPDQHGRAGQATAPLDLGTAFTDAAGDTLTFAATGLPPGLAFDPATGRVTGIIDPSLASPHAYTVTVTATDEKGGSVAETFIFTVDAVPPSILPQPSFFTPAAGAAFAELLRGAPARLVEQGHDGSVEPATPILDAINEISGDEERSQVISLDGIVVSTVNGIAPLNGLQRLSEPGTSIVRSGAATDERGDRFERTHNALGRGVEALSTPLNFLGATSIDVDAASRGEIGPTINIETMLRDRVLSISVGSGAGPGDPLARVVITLADGRPLPTWLRADGHGYLVGKVPGGVESIDLKITSTFASGATSQRSVTIRTDRGTIMPVAPRPQAGRTLSHMVAASRFAPADLSRIARLLD